ncbi:MAG: MFS transporter, partial [Desulfovibrionaceae bacterium]|nr:MFS transporter [Desulfovibrionaceae bacterium]
MGKREMTSIPCGPNPLVLIYGTALISVMGVAGILPVLPAMGKAFGLPPSSLGLLVISFTLPGIVLAPVGGVLADRLGRKAVLAPCLCLFALGGLAGALSDTLA